MVDRGRSDDNPGVPVAGRRTDGRARAIETENPKYNIMHKGGKAVANVKGTEIPTKSKYVMTYDGDKYAVKYGRYFWCVEYGDGEWITLYADRYEIGPGGVLTFWSFPKQLKAHDPFDDTPRSDRIEQWEDRPDEPEQSLASFGPGSGRGCSLRLDGWQCGCVRSLARASCLTRSMLC